MPVFARRDIAPAVFAIAALATGVQAVAPVANAVGDPTARALLEALYEILRTAIALAFALFTIGRAAPRSPSRSPLAFAACAVAMGPILTFRPPPHGTPELLVVGGEALTAAASAWLVVAVMFLGRCFGVLPEARGLVRSGPYAIVRHPIYAGEIGVFVGLTIASPLLVNVIMLGGVLGVQWVRMKLEESALSAAFPQYQLYAAEVPRLLPSLRRRTDRCPGSLASTNG
jgi:protein-S-isoprenylcysteine O-methyltransferase Ste14